MKVLITGSAGFIATHVKKRLPEGAIITEVDCYEPRVHKDCPDSVSPQHAGNISAEELRLIAPDIIIHLAAQVGVADSMDDPFRYVDDNTNDTYHFLENLRASGVRPRRLIVASSMSVYGDPKTSAPISEDHPVRPASVYGLTKFDQEAACLMYGEMLGISTAALRFFNVYGPGQALHNPYTGVLAIFANAILQGKHPTVYEDGLQTRDFVYVEDVAEAVVRMACESGATGVFNVATGVPTTIYDVARRLAVALGRPELAPHITHESRPGDIRHCVGDSTRLLSALPGWEPRTFEDGVGAYADALKEAHVTL